MSDITSEDLQRIYDNGFKDGLEEAARVAENFRWEGAFRVQQMRDALPTLGPAIAAAIRARVK
jgi:hypothetical protein